MVCGAEAAVLCVSSGGGGAARGRPAHRGGAALVCVANDFGRCEPRLGFGRAGALSRFRQQRALCNRFQQMQTLPTTPV